MSIHTCHAHCPRPECVATRKTAQSKAAAEARGNAARNKLAKSRPPAPIAQSVADLHHLAERTAEHVERGTE